MAGPLPFPLQLPPALQPFRLGWCVVCAHAMLVPSALLFSFLEFLRRSPAGCLASLGVLAFPLAGRLTFLGVLALPHLAGCL